MLLGGSMNYVRIKPIVIAGGIILCLSQLYTELGTVKLEKNSNVVEGTLYINSKELEHSMNINYQMDEKTMDTGVVTDILSYNRSDGTQGTIVVVDESIEALINHYCKVFNVNYEIANSIAQSHIKSDSFKNSFNIPGTTVRGQERVFSNLEAGIIAFVKSLKERPDKYGYTKEAIFYDYQYTTDQLDEDLIAHTCEVFGNMIPKEIVLSIFLHESHIKTSTQYMDFNNGYGITGTSGSLLTFSNREEATITAVMNHIYRYVIDENFNPTDSNFLAQMQPIYAPIGALNDPNNLNQNWLTGVRHFYNIVNQDYYAYSNSTNYLDEVKLATTK